MATVFTLDGINQELLLGTPGDDLVQDSATRRGVWNGSRGIIRLLKGNDRIRSRSFIQIRGETALGPGRDLITGQTVMSLLAVGDLNGKVDMGPGADTIGLKGGRLIVGEDSTLALGDGDDRILARDISLIGGVLDAGMGKDRIICGGMLSAQLSALDMGDGDDALRVRGGMVLGDGSVTMGRNNDTVNVLQGGLDLFNSSANTLNLGPGDDRFIGFAVIPDPEQETAPGGLLRGGRGNDTVVLPEGVYRVSRFRISTPETFLPLRSIEALEGINGGRFSYAPGILTVDSSGIASFAAALV
ncbi:hypothetical protein [Aphanothece microscopica]